MRILEVTYRIATPMFVCGADQDHAELRPPSFKGALRFWWRALHWAEFRNNAGNDQEALNKMHDAEADIFGLAAGTRRADGQEKKGQGCFSLTLKGTPEACQPKRSEARPFGQQYGLDYLLGMGLWHFRNGLLRGYLKDGSDISAVLMFKHSATQQHIEQVSKAAFLLGLLGGLGSRSRRGLGSLAIQNLNPQGLEAELPAVPKSVEQLKGSIANLISPSALELSLPPFSAFSKESRIQVSLSDPRRSAVELLASAGKEMQLYRGYGFETGGRRIVAGEQAEQNFKADHDNMADVSAGKNVKAAPERTVFGMPHNYFFRSTRARVDVVPSSNHSDRRASPLFVHAHTFPDGGVAVIQTLLPAVFLPDGEQIELNPGRGRAQSVSAEVDWQVLHKYLDRFDDRKEVLI